MTQKCVKMEFHHQKISNFGTFTNLYCSTCYFEGTILPPWKLNAEGELAFILESLIFDVNL